MYVMCLEFKGDCNGCECGRYSTCGTCGNLIIELIQHKVWMNRKDGLFDHIAMEVENIEETSERLKEPGITFEADIYFDDLVFDRGVTYQAFRGPDGEHLEIYQTL